MSGVSLATAALAKVGEEAVEEVACTGGLATLSAVCKKCNVSPGMEQYLMLAAVPVLVATQQKPGNVGDIVAESIEQIGKRDELVEGVGDIAGAKPIKEFLESGDEVVDGLVDTTKKLDPVTDANQKQLDEIVEAYQTSYVQSSNDFVGKLRGENIILQNVKGQVIEYTKVSTEELATLRHAFNTSERKNFLKSLTADDDMIAKLKKAGLNNADIQDVADGFVPNGYQVHHKIPLDGGGTNSFDNLILIKNDPYHMVITNTQKSLTTGLHAGETITLNEWPMPEGSIYPTE